MRVILRRAIVTFLLALPVTGTSNLALAQDEPATTPEPVTVSMRGDLFLPDVITIAAGMTVVWSNDEDDPTDKHNAIAVNGNFTSPDMVGGETWSFTFDRPGRYQYYCDWHESMYGWVIVQ
jgi:plastocyanin